MAEKPGAIFRDAVATHQTDGFAHRIRAVTGIPELGGRAEHIAERVEQHKFHERIGRLLGGGGAGLLHQLQRDGFEFLDFLERGTAGQLALPKRRVLLAFERINLVE